MFHYILLQHLFHFIAHETTPLDNDEILIKVLRQETHYDARKLLAANFIREDCQGCFGETNVPQQDTRRYTLAI